MRRSARILALAATGLLAATLTGCGGEDAPETRDLTVMTRNMYLGADLMPLFGASSNADLAQRATAVWQQVEASDVAARVSAVAAEIAAAQPDVVALQEVSLWRTDPTPDGPLLPATEVRYDVLAMLEEALAADASGTGYRATTVSVSEGFDGELPTTLGFDVRLTDRDVILVRTGEGAEGLTATEYATDTFDAGITVEAVPGTTVRIPRGWAAVDVTLGEDRTVRVFGTHLEALDGPEQVAQAKELSDRAASAAMPVIILGDINSRADGPPDTSTYADLVGAGWLDAWPAVSSSPAGSGDTCCQAPDLRNPESQLTERIDVALAASALTPTAASVTGTDPALRTPSGLWPSDHAGVVVTYTVPRAE